MSVSNGGTRSLVALAALAAVGFGTLAGSVLLATGNGRDTNNCVQACNALRDLCKETCPAACGSIYTPGTPEYTACLQLCRAECVDVTQDCKRKCNPHYMPVSNPEP